MAELHELEARILALVAVRSGTADDAAAADAARERARETTTAIRSIPVPAGPPPTEDLKTLFRDAAKRMHPDLQQDPDGRVHAEAFMSGSTRPTAPATPRRSRTSCASGRPCRMRRRRRATPTGSCAWRCPGERRLDEARGAELARLMERSLAASIEGRDLLLELKREAEAALVAGRARLAALEASS